MELFSAFIASDLSRVIVKLVLSVVLSGVIGLERSANSKPAGFGTHAILGVSACLIVISSEYFAMFFDVDASRIPAQILSGIGFIGAGAIMRNGYNVKGITTAAGLFAVTCIGIAVGIGYYSAACVATLLIFLLMSYSHNITDKLERYETIDLNILLDKEKDTKDTLKEINNFFKNKHINIVSVSHDADKKSGKLVQYIINYNTRTIDKSEILATMMAIDEIAKVELVDE